MKIVIQTDPSGKRTVLTTDNYLPLTGSTRLEKNDLLLDIADRIDGYQVVVPIAISSIHHPCAGICAENLPSSAFAFREVATPATKPIINTKFRYTAPSFDAYSETYGEYMSRRAKDTMLASESNQEVSSEPSADDFVGVKPMSFARIKKRLVTTYHINELLFVKLPLMTFVAKNDIIVAKSGIQCTLSEAHAYPHYNSDFCGMGYVTCNKPGWGGGTFTVSRVLEDSGGFAIYRAQTGPIKYTSANKVDPLPLP